MAEHPNYIIYAPSYNGQSGGSIFQHALAESLLELGESVFLWPMAPLNKIGFRKQLGKWLANTKFVQKPRADIAIANRQLINDRAIVLYPEIVPGNPLGAKNIVRWLMYKPGLLNRPTKFGKGDMFFACSDFADDVSLTGGAERLALIVVNPIYKLLNKRERSGSCYMLRKFQGTPDPDLIKNSTRLDALSHEEIVQEFNKCEVFYCYDDATMYSQYAAVCGCTSVVIPQHYTSRAKWVKDRPIARFGVAYGLGDKEHACQTRHLVSDHIKSLEAEGIKSVERFVKQTKDRFGFR